MARSRQHTRNRQSSPTDRQPDRPPSADLSPLEAPDPRLTAVDQPANFAAEESVPGGVPALGQLDDPNATDFAETGPSEFGIPAGDGTTPQTAPADASLPFAVAPQQDEPPHRLREPIPLTAEAGLGRTAEGGAGPNVESRTGADRDQRRPAPPAAEWRFHIDEVSETKISGWIQNQRLPSHRAVIVLKEADEVVARTVASDFRPDLLSAGVGDGFHAFRIAIPDVLFDYEEHFLEIIEEDTGCRLTPEPIRWRGNGLRGPAGLGGTTERPGDLQILDLRPQLDSERGPLPARGDGGLLDRPAVGREPWSGALPQAKLPVAAGTRILFDISDLVYYLGHHPNLTGIQRVQSSISLCLLKTKLIDRSRLVFLSFSHDGAGWVIIPAGFLRALLEDLLKPEAQRQVAFSQEEAKRGLLPGAKKFDGSGFLDDGNPSVLCVTGAVWAFPDYFHHVRALKRKFGTRLVLEIHDLIPIYAREFCDQNTVRVFERFLRRALRHTDQFLAGSENTKKDLIRYAASLGVAAPAVTVVQYGSALDEFWEDAKASADDDGADGQIGGSELPDRFVLFVSTIEGRKNHHLMLKIWRRMLEAGEAPPHLVCVGRVGWKSEGFITELVETDYLNGRVMLLQDISDTELRRLFARCLFTVFPSMYEGWGLPVAESLALGKVCVSSDRTSIPEVAGDLGVYVDIDDPEQCYRVIRELIVDPKARQKLESRIRRHYRPIAWRTVAERIVGACDAAASAEWDDAYPDTLVPYSTEISFARLEREIRGQFGDEMLAGIGNARRAHFLNAPLDELSFLRGEEARAGERWGEPEDWGTWSCGAGGEIALVLPPTRADSHYVFLRMNVVSPLADVPIALLANGAPAWRGAIGSASRNLFFRVRRRADADRGWRLKIRAQVNLSDALHAQIQALDGRVPTIGFQRLVVVPEDDLKARIDIMTNLLRQLGI